MGPPLRGKKGWRRNLEDAEVIEHIAQETHQERRGPAVESLPDTQLFFVDKAADTVEAMAAAAAAKRQKKAPRPTRAQLILSAPQLIQPVLNHVHRAKQDKGPVNPKLAKQQQQQQAAQRPPGKPRHKSDSLATLWSDDVSQPQPVISQPHTMQPSQPASAAAAAAAAAADMQTNAATVLQTFLPEPASARPSKQARKRKPGTHGAAPRIPALEVDMAGCSYNPEPASHQDALAVLVASEMKKILRQELAPKPVPLTVPLLGPVEDELAQLQTVADEDENEIPLDGVESDGAAGAGSRARSSKKTRKDRNKEERLAAEQQAVAARAALKAQRKQLAALPAVEAELEVEAHAQAARRARRKVVQEEKAVSQPPRLGKLRFEDLPVQVLTSDELHQGLRRLKPYPMLAKERFKSIEKRGLIEPRRPLGNKAQGRRVEFEKGSRTEKAVEGQQELEALKKLNRAAVAGML